mmetsp:Transcript_39129/g.122390  ORF Transcript_39129/g.122390 Transcript_39129/m.122390 type:complete len:209 (-) Transcript_39129:1187-1813(-)
MEGFRVRGSMTSGSAECGASDDGALRRVVPPFFFWLLLLAIFLLGFPYTRASSEPSCCMLSGCDARVRSDSRAILCRSADWGRKSSRLVVSSFRAATAPCGPVSAASRLEIAGSKASFFFFFFFFLSVTGACAWEGTFAVSSKLVERVVSMLWRLLCGAIGDSAWETAADGFDSSAATNRCASSSSSSPSGLSSSSSTGSGMSVALRW